MRFIYFLIFLFVPFGIFAQENTPTETPDIATGAIEMIQTGVTGNPLLPKCSDVIGISGAVQVRLGTTHEYSLVDNNGSVAPTGFFRIQMDDYIEDVKATNSKLSHTFNISPGIATITFTPIDSAAYNCVGSITREVHVYREVIMYIGKERTDIGDSTLASVFREKSVLLDAHFVGNSFQIEDQSALWNAIGAADILVINHDNIIELFSEMERLQRIKENIFTNTKIFIISPHSRTLLAKVLAKSIANLGITDNNISLISADQLSTLLGKWAYEDDREVVLGETLSYEKNHFALTMSSFLEYLAYSGVSYQFLGFLLLLSVVALIFNILKQIIGLDTFSVYYPLLFAIIVSQMGYTFSLVFAALAVISVIVSNAITNRIQLLVNAKKAFLLSMYIFLLLAAMGVDNVFEIGIFNYTIFQNSVAIVGIFAILFIMERLIDGIKFFSKSGILELFRYAVIIAIVVAIFSSRSLQYFLISYPDVIFLIVIANLLVGRYTGLQVVEYFRFSPVLRNISEEE